MHTYHTPCEMELNNNNVRSFDYKVGWQLDGMLISWDTLQRDGE